MALWRLELAQVGIQLAQVVSKLAPSCLQLEHYECACVDAVVVTILPERHEKEM